MKKKVVLYFFALLAVLYFGGTYFFIQYSFPNTMVNGVEHSFQRVANLFEYKGTLEPIQVVGRGEKTLTISPDAISLQKKPKGAPRVTQNPMAWPVAFFGSHNYTAEYEYLYSAENLETIIAESGLMEGQAASVDAKILQGEDGFTIEPEVIGSIITKENVEAVVVEALAKGETQVEIPDALYEQPKLLATDPALVKETDTLNEIFQTKITYDFVDREYTFTGDTLVGLHDKMPDGEYVINYDRTRALLADMATETDTFQSDREFTTYYGNTITIPGGSGIHGWLMNVDATTEEFIEWVEARHSEETTPFYYHKGNRRELDEIGDTYVEIDLDDQWMYVYLDGQLIDEGPTVSGQPNLGTPTPVGVNTIIDKMRDRYLKGTEPDTGKAYSSLVNFWFSINWSDIGIHNSTWRTSFGGDIYRWNGSYGCINVVDHLAETIYYNIPVGTPVISY